ncbi:3'-5' exonuclease [Sulfurimonas lithotrophica]|uniref:3'-5' exonuclease n=1 Tax=Sulfurimonas lithotrophica TaxID=2590022 RepID=A0A5P8NZQ7_9BACT|nr:3'-5' exonuclease [Sulfurimonas lithotrophica]QFR48923.1 3'-5' exonuclease [Sulfurimonas lithotrophica]
MFDNFFRELSKKRDFKRLKDKKYEFLFEEDNSGEYVVFDTETTGLNPKKDDILSIGAVKIKDNKILTSQTFEMFVQNYCDISSESKKIHGIREVDLINAQTTLEVIPKFLEFIGSRPLVGYYLEFDVAMINKYVKPMLGIKLPNKQIEVSEIYYNQKIEFIPQGNIDLKFDTILQNCGIPNMGAHNAVNDAIMTAMIYLKLIKGNNNVR